MKHKMVNASKLNVQSIHKDDFLKAAKRNISSTFNTFIYVLKFKVCIT